MFVRYPPGRSARRVTSRSRCWAAAARRRPIAWSLGRSVADDLGAQQPRHLALYPTGPEVLVVHPEGTVSGSAAEVAAWRPRPPR